MQFDRRVTIQTATRSEVYPGEYEEAWTSGASVWAHVSEETGREAIRAGQVDAEQAVVVTTRYEATQNVTANDRLLYDGEVLHIQSIREVGRRVEREFLCLRVAATTAGGV